MSIQGLLKDATGLNLGRNQVERAVRERMEATGQSDRKQYAHELAHGDAAHELAQLVELVVVPESWLFRDPQAFAVAVEFVKVRLARGARLVRILSVPCAGGEEPYSMAMALCDAGVPLESFAIDALDISAGCVARASGGVFGRNAFRAQDLGFRERYFTPVQGSDDLHRIAASLQQRVRIRQGNVLLEGSAPSASYDIIFCRNLLIYFDRPTAATAAARLSALLADDGIMFAGYAEVPVFTQNGFVPLPHRHAFALRKALAEPGDTPAWAALPGAAPVPRRVAAATAAAHRAPRPAAGLSAAGAGFATGAGATSFGTLAVPASPAAGSGPAGATAGLSQRLRPRVPRTTAAWPGASASASLAGAYVSLRGDAALASAPSSAALLAQARQLADQGRTTEAAAACRDILAKAPETPDAYFILALLAEAGQKPEDAEQQLKRCLYLQPEHYEALCHLALLAEQGGNRSAAANLKARAARVYQRQHAN